MNAAQAVALLRQRYPALPPDAAPVYFLLCGEDVLTTSAIARRLDLAQSTTARLLALLVLSGLVAQADSAARQVRRWTLTPTGCDLAQSLNT